MWVNAQTGQTQWNRPILLAPIPKEKQQTVHTENYVEPPKPEHPRLFPLPWEEEEEQDGNGNHRQDAEVLVIHGIRGEDLGLDPALPVDVAVNGGCFLAGFTFGEVAGPVALAPGDYVIEISLADPDDPHIPPGAAHRILLVDTYHHIHDRPAYFRRLQAALAPGGCVVVRAVSTARCCW